MRKFETMGNTLLFIAAVLFVIAFHIIFGTYNGLIGVYIVMASLTMLRKDLTLEPIKNSVKLVLLNIAIGIAGILATESFLLGVVLTFLIFFFLGYFLLYSLEKPLYIPFALEYLYILLTPIPNRLIPLRIIALAIGGVIIIGINYLYYISNNRKDEDRLIIDLCNIIISKCNLIINGKNTVNLDVALDKSIKNLRRVIFNKNSDRLSLNSESAVKLAVINGLEKLNFLIPQLHCDEDKRYILKEISVFLNTVESGLKTRKLFELEDALYKIKLREDNKNNYSTSCLSVINLLDFIHSGIGEIIKLNLDSKKTYNSLIENNARLNLNNSKLPILSFKFYFALRIALGMAIATLVSGFFIFSEGIWALVSTFAIMLPLYSNDKKSIRYKIHVTLLGAAISYLIFTIFKDFGARTLVILVASYFYGFFEKEYKYSGIFISICAFGMGFIVYSSLNIFSINILFLIGSSAIIAMVFESLLLAYDFHKTKDDLKKIYGNTLTEFLEEIHNLSVNEKHSHIINSLLMFSGLLEDRMTLNNEYLHDEALSKFIKDQRLLLFTLYELYLWMDNNDLSTKTKSILNKFVNHLLNEETVTKDELQLLLTQGDFPKSLDDKVALNTLNEISNLIFNLTP